MRKLILKIALLLLMPFTLHGETLNPSELAQLNALYFATNGANWTNNDNWLTGDPCNDNWFGITCLPLDEINFPDLWTINSIELPNNNLVGSINGVDMSVFKLIYTLALSNNQISGVFPNITNVGFTRLHILDLSFNDFSGTIPNTINHNIISLDLLDYLILESNQFTGSIPNGLGGLNGLNLNYLNLSNNNLSGTIPSDLGDIANIESIFFNNNQLSGIIPKEIENLLFLRNFDVSHNLLSGSIPVELGNLPSLYFLGLVGNQLSGSIPEELGNLSSLSFLRLDSNQLIGSIPAELGNLSNLYYLTLHDNQMNGLIPIQLGNLTNLNLLDLSGNQFSGSIPSELGNLINLKNLWLSGNQLSGVIPIELGNLTSLESLILISNQLSGSIPVEIGNLTSLISLWLSDNQLSGLIPTELGGLSSLDSLFLDRNQFNGSIPLEMNNLVNLITSNLNLDFNALHSNNTTTNTFIDTKCNCDWQATQTTAPNNLQIIATSEDSISLNWDSVTYQQNGGYQVSMASDAIGPFTQVAQTVSKNITAHTQGGLMVGQNYYFNIKSFTNPHANNQNLVTSDSSSDVSDVTGTTTASADLYSVIDSDNPLIKAAGNYQYYRAEIGDTFIYNIVVGNNGPDDAVNAGFRHNLPVGLSNGTWTCVANSGSATCPQASEMGNIDELLNLPNASSLKFNLSAQVTSVASDSLLITATITPPDGVSDSDLISNVQFMNFTDSIFVNGFE